MAEPTPLSPDSTQLLRHLVAATAFRSSRVLRDAPSSIGEAAIAEGAMPGAVLVNHMTNVLAYAYAKLTNTERQTQEQLDWQGEVDRFYEILQRIDDALAKGVTLETPEFAFKLLQGPFADVLTHVGQLAALRRVVGVPVPGENYIKANVQIGRCGIEQD